MLILGAGGLGCPAAIYLAAAGVGHLGVVDYDVVELSNLHRQIMHREAGIGTSKAASLAQAVRSLNSLVRVTIHDVQLDGSNAMEIVSGYDVVLDCSDNPATRYLINDACVLSGRPLISGSALRWEGQLTVYNYRGGPCYRCLYPTPPNPKFVTNCSDGGVIGAGTTIATPPSVSNQRTGHLIRFVPFPFSSRFDWYPSGDGDHQASFGRDKQVGRNVQRLPSGQHWPVVQSPTFCL